MTKHRNLSRRDFLIGLGAATVLIGGVGIWRGSKVTQINYIEAVVRNRLGYLRFSDVTLQEFASEFVEFIPAMQDGRGKVVAAQGMTLSRAAASVAGGDLAWKLEVFEQRIASEFLKSTDFFLFDRDTERMLEYIGFADAYTNGCSNSVAVLR